MVTGLIPDPPCLPGDYHVWKVERSWNWKTGVPYPWDQEGRIEGELGLEEGEERLIDAEYATDVPSHHQGVQVVHVEQGDHFAQRFLSRCRKQIYTSQVWSWMMSAKKGLTVSLSYVYEYGVVSAQVVRKDADNVYTRVSRRVDGNNWVDLG